MKKIRLTQGYEAIVDDKDYQELSKYKWQYHLGYAKRGEYDKIKRNNKIIKMHRQIMGFLTDMVIHHQNHDRLDNRRSNLIVCTQKQNVRSQKQKKSGKSTSKHQGVYKRKNGNYANSTGGYTAKIKVDYIDRYLGTFPTEDEAGLAYNIAAKQVFGKFAILNDIPKGTKVSLRRDRAKRSIANLTSTKATGGIAETSVDKHIKSMTKRKKNLLRKPELF